MRLLLEKRGDEVSLLPALACGGEGAVHPVLGRPGVVAKVFKGPSVERAEKLSVMIDNPPAVTRNAPILLAWPEDRLLDHRGECVGYVMPYAKDKETCSTVSHPKDRPSWASDFGFRLRAAKNAAAAVSAFHRHGYVVGDVNDSNVLVGKDASVAVVDTDSIQVPAAGRVFRCPVGKEFFTPPELIRPGGSFADIDRHPHHDAFGLAVLVFRLLMDGHYPFDAQYLGAGPRPTPAERVAQGAWPHSKNRNSQFLPSRGAPSLESLHPELQRLMHECFEAGHKNPACRPTADEWCKALAEAEVEWATPKAKLRHYYHRLRTRGRWEQEALDALGRLWPAAARIPREVWAAAGGAGLTLCVCCWLGAFDRSVPPAGNPAGERTRDEETLRPWQNPNRRWRGGSESGSSPPRANPTEGEETPDLWREVFGPGSW